MTDSTLVPLAGRRAEAARNDKKILEAARAVFLANPNAPIAEVAQRAGVGIGALYRRFPSKEDLLRTLCGEGLQRYIAEAEAALADGRDPWTAFAEFMRRAVAADTSSLTVALAGTFTPSAELFREATRAGQLTSELLRRTRAAGVLRLDVAADDLSLLFEQIAAVRLGDEARTKELRQRYLTLVLDGLRASPGTPLPGRPPDWDEISGRWNAQGRR